ncbi:hypothetical protein GCM10023085_42010 [Actinomadura viridis]
MRARQLITGGHATIAVVREELQRGLVILQEGGDGAFTVAADPPPVTERLRVGAVRTASEM